MVFENIDEFDCAEEETSSLPISEICVERSDDPSSFSLPLCSFDKVNLIMAENARQI